MSADGIVSVRGKQLGQPVLDPDGNVIDYKGGGTVRAVLFEIAVAASCDDEQRCRLTKMDLAVNTNLSKRSVINATRELVERGLIVEHGTVQTKGGQAVIYRLNLDAIRALPDHPSKGKGGEGDSLPVVNEIHHFEPKVVKEIHTIKHKNKKQTKQGDFFGGEKEDHSPPPKQTPEQEFEVWYEAYPHKRDRGRALRAFKAARKKKGVTLDVLLAGLRREIAERDRKSKIPGEFIPRWKHPASWLNAEAWTNEGESPATNGETASGLESGSSYAKRFHQRRAAQESRT